MPDPTTRTSPPTWQELDERSQRTITDSIWHACRRAGVRALEYMDGTGCGESKTITARKRNARRNLVAFDVHAAALDRLGWSIPLVAGAHLERVRAWLRGEELQACDDCDATANVQVTAEGRRTVCCACLAVGYDSSGEPFDWYAFDGKERGA